MPVLGPEEGLELLKLVLHVGWSDLRLKPDERRFINRFADALALPPIVFETLLPAWLDAGQPVPNPDLVLLRRNKSAVIEMMARTAFADGVLVPDEAALLDRVVAMLEGAWQGS